MGWTSLSERLIPSARTRPISNSRRTASQIEDDPPAHRRCVGRNALSLRGELFRYLDIVCLTSTAVRGPHEGARIRRDPHSGLCRTNSMASSIALSTTSSGIPATWAAFRSMFVSSRRKASSRSAAAGPGFTARFTVFTSARLRLRGGSLCNLDHLQF